MDVHLFATLPLWLAAFLLSLTCHEAAHALAGKLGGDSTAAAQVTLDTAHPEGTLRNPRRPHLVLLFAGRGLDDRVGERTV